jgi:hypothetical protein
MERAATALTDLASAIEQRQAPDQLPQHTYDDFNDLLAPIAPASVQ